MTDWRRRLRKKNLTQCPGLVEHYNMPWMRAIDAHFEMFGFKPGDRVYLRFGFDSRRVVTTPDYSALNWREQPYGAATQEEEKDEEYAALAPLRRSVVW
ncbi:hypothetical protein WS75_03840 [Burkholderia sp. FL-7-2-10-S1-D7]|uniref:hypothetical protein n=1 Tax=Burkholderia sp. FL-7-2-10-S1-D7 TaxID=1637866 RepID=UPI00075BF342|nr:hypothetical protein [Burkholderia sp. FL-7-2-10-S1-D7]KVF79355.1 hypothetical protein WS75_03840 [Burkholderia sp. FL-7-2-10-S1-D7]